MEPFLAPDRLLVCRPVATRPRRGSIVVFRHPRHSGMWLVKRVIGLPGEQVEIDFGRVLVDGDAGLDRWNPGQKTFPEGRWSVGDEQVLVLSDNRAATTDDSRSFGPVPTSDMFQVVWPFTRPARIRGAQDPQ